MQPAQCILFSGAAQGAEAAFGAAAERHGLEEVHFTFEGHNATRTRGMRVLTQAELQQGDVSLAYVSRLMHRTFRDTPLFRKVLQCIWHQVNHGQEIYVVGQILEDGTVKGARGGAPSSPSCATSRCSSLPKTRSTGSTGRGRRGRRMPPRGSPTPSSPAPARVFYRRAGCGPSTRCSRARFASVDIPVALESGPGHA